MHRMRQEIAHQPAAILETLEQERPHIAEVARRLCDEGIRFVLLVARGTSDNAATYARYLFQITNGRPAASAAPSVATLYNADVDLRECLMMGISQSGQATDVIECLEEAAELGAMTVALTNSEDSPICQAAQHVLITHARDEQSVPATKTYTTALAVIYTLSALWAQQADREQYLLRAVEAIEEEFQLEPLIEDRSERYRYMEACVVLARGVNLCTADEVALKLSETCYLVARGYSTAEFRHGPIAAVDEGFPVFVFAPRGPMDADILQTCRALRERRAELMVFSDVPEILEQAHIAVRMPGPLSETCAPIAYVVGGQLLAYHLSRHKGINPDEPRGLHKVTLTR